VVVIFLTGSASVTVIGTGPAIPGQVLYFIVYQGLAGGHTVSWTGLPAGSVFLAAGSASVQTFILNNAGTIVPLTPMTGFTDAGVQIVTPQLETFWGYYRNGETVAVPTSPVDGYSYQRSQLTYVHSLVSSQPPAGVCNGSQTPPGAAGNTGGGDVLNLGADVNGSTGAVSTYVNYYAYDNGQTHYTYDGVVKVTTFAQRF